MQHLVDLLESVLGDDEYSATLRALLGRLRRLCGEPGCAALCAKALIEAAIQALYMSQVEPGRRMEVLSRWVRRGSAFSMSMLERAKGVPGPVKRRVLRAYLRVAELVHPTPSGFTEPGPDVVARVEEAVRMLVKYIRLRG